MDYKETHASKIDTRNISDNVEDRKIYALKHGGFYFGRSSWRKLKTTLPEIQEWLIECIKWFNISVTDGVRDEDGQEAAINRGASTVRYPDSLHNPDNPRNIDQPGVCAVDVIPYPPDWEDLERFMFNIGKMMQIAEQMQLDMVSGSDWRKDGYMLDDKKKKFLRDYPHWQKKK